jgi:hypothetical protein
MPLFVSQVSFRDIKVDVLQCEKEGSAKTLFDCTSQLIF